MTLNPVHFDIFVIAFISAISLAIMIFLVNIFGRSLRYIQNKPRHDTVMLGDDMRGRLACVEEVDPVTGEFYIKLGAERWRGHCQSRFQDKIEVGKQVRVRGMKGLILDVRPDK